MQLIFAVAVGVLGLEAVFALSCCVFVLLQGYICHKMCKIWYGNEISIVSFPNFNSDL